MFAHSALCSIFLIAILNIREYANSLFRFEIPFPYVPSHAQNLFDTLNFLSHIRKKCCFGDKFHVVSRMVTRRYRIIVVSWGNEILFIFTIYNLILDNFIDRVQYITKYIFLVVMLSFTEMTSLRLSSLRQSEYQEI